MSAPPKRLVLVGAGHAHLYTLKRTGEFQRLGHEVVLVAPENFWYSGLATGMLGGRYERKDDEIEVAGVLGGAEWIRERAARIDPGERRVRLESGAEVRYDVLSLNLGSEVRALPGVTEGVFPIKPVRNLWNLRVALTEAIAAGRKPRVVVAGGGASGCEVAANIQALLRGRGAGVTLLTGGKDIVPELPPGAGKRLRRWLAEHEVRIETGARVVQVEAGAAVTAGGGRHPFDFLVNATGLQPPAVLATSGFPLGERGELLVDEFLRSTGDPRVFGGGDCIEMQHHLLKKNGVYAIRESPILFRNLLATLHGASLQAYHPQRRCLLILNLGGGMGLAHWGGLYWCGRGAGYLKHWLDTRFLALYR